MNVFKINPSNMLKLRHLAEYGAFQAILFVVRSLPVRASVGMANGLAWFIHRVLPRKMTRYQVCRDNLTLAFGESLSDADADRIILGMWQHLFRMVCEIVQLPRRFRLSNCAEVLEFVQRNEPFKHSAAAARCCFLRTLRQLGNQCQHLRALWISDRCRREAARQSVSPQLVQTLS